MQSSGIYRCVIQFHYMPVTLHFVVHTKYQPPSITDAALGAIHVGAGVSVTLLWFSTD